jgi:hypothetical protein
MSKIKKAELVAAAKELNNEFGLEPAIATGKTATEELLTEGIIKASKLYDPETDQLTDETLEILEALKPAESPKPKKGAAKKDANEPEESDYENEELALSEEQEDMLETLKGLKKTDDLLDQLEDVMFDEVREELSDEKNPIKLKAAMKRHITGEVAPAKAKKEKKAEVKKAAVIKKSRVEVATETVKKYAGQKVKLEDLVTEADEAYEKINPQESKWAVNMVIKVLGAAGLLEKEGDEVTVKEW